MSRPIWASQAWESAVLAAGSQCQCAGQCGDRHADADGRCPHLGGDLGAYPLYVIGSGADSTVMCGTCSTAVTAKDAARAKRKRREQAPVPDALF